VRAWRSNGAGHWQYRKVSYGTCSRGWFVHRIGQAWSGAWLVPDERAACELIEKWMHGAENQDRTWIPTPAAYDAFEQPADGLPWLRSGGQWLPGPASDEQTDESSVNAEG
jgi:hypothetical protein